MRLVTRWYMYSMILQSSELTVVIAVMYDPLASGIAGDAEEAALLRKASVNIHHFLSI